MINCQNCGAENLMTSIFCHSCGAKLDLDAAAPEEQMQEEEKEKKKKKIIGRVIKGVVALIILGFVACFFIPISVQQSPSLSAKERGNIKETWNWLETEFDREQFGTVEVPMSPAKASWVLNRVLETAAAGKEENSKEGSEEDGESSEKTANGDGGFQLISSPKGQLELRDKNYVKLVVQVKILNLIPMHRSAVFHVTGSGRQSSPTAETASAKIGIMPFPGPSKKLVGSWIWQELSQHSNLRELQDDVRNVRITSKQLVVVTKGKPEGANEGTGNKTEESGGKN